MGVGEILSQNAKIRASRPLEGRGGNNYPFHAPVACGVSFFVFRFSPQTVILNDMRFAPIVSMLVMSLALNAQTIQGKVVRVSDENTINGDL